MSFISFSGERSAERMERVAELVRLLGGVAVEVARDNPLENGITLEDQRLQPMLRRSIFANIEREGSSYESARIHTVRDVLTLGKSGVAGIASTPLRMERLERLLETLCPGEALLDHPTPENIARWCWRLDQVDARAVPHVRSHLYPALAAQARDNFRGPIRITVEDVLRGQTALPPDAVVTDWEDVYDATIAFAGAFIMERERLESE